MAQLVAARVFATPELLENILLLFAHNKKNKARGWSSRYLASLNKDQVTLWKTSQFLIHELFVWQRISKTTRDILMGSSKLRQLMFIDPYPADSLQAKAVYHSLSGYTVHASGILEPVAWLLNRMKDVLGPANHDDQVLENCKYSPTGSDAVFMLSRVTINDRSPPQDFLEDSMNRRYATWKSLPMCRIVDFKRELSIVQHFNVNDEVWYQETFEVKQKTTLGEFYDWYLCGRQSLDLEHHRALFRVIRTQGEPWIDERFSGWVQEKFRGGLIERR